MIDFGSRQTLQELSGIGGERTHIATLTLGVEGVESERRLAGPGRTRDDRQRAQRNRTMNPAQIVGSGIFDLNLARQNQFTVIGIAVSRRPSQPPTVASLKAVSASRSRPSRVAVSASDCQTSPAGS